MSLLKRSPEEVVLASPMEGQITLHGKPAAGAKVIRKVSQNEGDEMVDETTIDKDGNFKLPILRKVIELGKLTQYAVLQKIVVMYAGESYKIWTMGSRSRHEYGELQGKPSNFRCELTNLEKPFNLDTGLLSTKCVWDSIKPVVHNEHMHAV